ncbi:HEPN domain protein [Thermus aquaticus]|uniref:HEPN domain protein n=1 Tax=Thermus aquaticus TaxID=271 RepID=A0A0N0U8E6_THEAQ|nr:HEPN domain-containing protein [Thermus aquaticus]KOX90776.1 HEPN domain protein [Thermus aquaticus]
MREGFFEWAAFAAQQGAEKAVKAVFQRMGAVAWGHSVAGLLEELSQSFPVPEALLDAASELDKAYIPSRYPDALPEGAPFERYRRPEAERLLAHGEAVYAFCEGLLSQMD